MSRRRFNNSRQLLFALLVIALSSSFLITPTNAQVDCITCGGKQPDPMLKVEDFLACIDVKKSISDDACKSLKDKYEDKCCNAGPPAGSKGKTTGTKKKSSSGGGGGGGGGGDEGTDMGFIIQLIGLVIAMITMFMVCYSTCITKKSTRVTIDIEQRLDLLEKDILDLAESGIPMTMPKGGFPMMNSGKGGAGASAAPIIINNAQKTNQSIEEKEAQEEERMLEQLRERIIGDMSNLYYQMKNNTLEVAIRNHKYIKYGIDIEECHINDDKRIWQNYNETYDDFFSKFILYGSQISSHFNPDLKSKMDEVLGGFVKANKLIQGTYYNKEKGGIKITTKGGDFNDEDSDDDEEHSGSDSDDDNRKKKSKRKSKKKKQRPMVFKEDTSKFDSLINGLMTEIVEFDTEMADHIQIEKMKNIRAREAAAASVAGCGKGGLNNKSGKKKRFSNESSVGGGSRYTAATMATSGRYDDDIDEFDDEFDHDEQAYDTDDYRRREDRAILNSNRRSTRSTGGNSNNNQRTRRSFSNNGGGGGGNRGGSSNRHMNRRHSSSGNSNRGNNNGNGRFSFGRSSNHTRGDVSDMSFM